MNFASNQNYVGLTISGNQSFKFQNVTFQNCTFDGTINVSGSTNIKFLGCKFNGPSAGGRCIDHFGGVDGLIVDGCTFTGNHGDGAILGWNAVNSQFTNNVFDSCTGDGIHSFFGGAPKANNLIKGNIFRNQGHFALEQQGSAMGLEICFNVVESWQPGSSQIGFSIATGGDHGGIDPNNPSSDTSHGVNAHDNFISDKNLAKPGANAGNFGAIEVMGYDFQCHHNLVGTGGGWNCIAFYTLTSSHWSCHDNTGVGVNKVLDSDAPSNKMVPPGVNAGNVLMPAGAISAPATSDVLAGRCSWQSGGGVTPTPTPPPVDPNAPTNVTATPQPGGKLLVTWSDPTNGVDTPTLTVFPTGAPNLAKSFPLAAGTTSATIAGVNDTWVVQCAVTNTFNGAVSAKGSSAAVQVSGGPAANAPWVPTLVTAAPVVPAKVTVLSSWRIDVLSDGTANTTPLK